jgi:F420-0:gamma-glutamyl ligase-like protein
MMYIVSQYLKISNDIIVYLLYSIQNIIWTIKYVISPLLKMKETLIINLMELQKNHKSQLTHRFMIKVFSFFFFKGHIIH